MNKIKEKDASDVLQPPEPTTANHHCANCNTALAGRYCHTCGQTAHVHRSISHMIEELLHGILHFDSKAWRTLPALILHPGKLTRDYIDGKRTRYVSPLFLFLFLNLVMFVSLSYIGRGLGPEGTYKSLFKTGMTNEINNIQTRLDELDTKRQALSEKDPTLAAIATEVTQLKLKQSGIKKSLAATEAEDLKALTKNSTASKIWFEENLNHLFQNPDLVLYKMKGSASKFAFILIPISLPFIWLLFFRRKDIVLFDHCIFSLYSLSFMCLVIILVAGFARLHLAYWAWALFLLAPPLHMCAQLRGTYNLSIGAALWRTLILSLIASFALSVYFVAIAWLSS